MLRAKLAFKSRTTSVFPARDFEQVIAKLSFHWTLDFSDRSGKDHFVEFLNHHTRTEFSKRAAFFTRWALGVLLSQFGEGNASIDLRLERCALRLR